MKLTRREQKKLEEYRQTTFAGQGSVFEELGLDEPAGEDRGVSHQPASSCEQIDADEKEQDDTRNMQLF